MLTLTVTLLVASPDGAYIVGRFDLQSPMSLDEEPWRWSLAMPAWEWCHLLWSLLHMDSRLMKVNLRNEQLIATTH